MTGRRQTHPVFWALGQVKTAWRGFYIGVLIGALAAAVHSLRTAGIDTLSERALLGDYIGGIASGVAMILMVAALMMQREELRLQRVELQQTRREMRLGNEEQARHRELLEGQQKILGQSLSIETQEHERRGTAQLTFQWRVETQSIALYAWNGGGSPGQVRLLGFRLQDSSVRTVRRGNGLYAFSRVFEDSNSAKVDLSAGGADTAIVPGSDQLILKLNVRPDNGHVSPPAQRAFLESLRESRLLLAESVADGSTERRLVINWPIDTALALYPDR